MIIRDITGYRTSRDYGALYELAKTQSIVCTVEVYCRGDRYDPPIRDIAHTLYHGTFVEIGCRGNGFVSGGTKEDFIANCERSLVEWIMPDADEGAMARYCDFMEGVYEKWTKRDSVDIIARLDLRCKQSIVDLLMQVQVGRVSCRRAAREIQKRAFPKKHLTADERTDIVRMRNNGTPVKDIAARYDIHPTTVWRVCSATGEETR